MFRSLNLMILLITSSMFAMCFASAAQADENAKAFYETKVSRILEKHCTACHSADDSEGKLALDSFPAILKGGASGAAIIPGDSKSSRLIRVLNGSAKPKMPPEEKGPSNAELEILIDWIDVGAPGPTGKPTKQKELFVPNLPASATAKSPVLSLAWSPNQNVLAVGKYKMVELRSAKTNQLIKKIDELTGKVNSVSFSADGQWLVTASGVSGLNGVATIWNAKSGAKIKEFSGHSDVMYSAALSPDKKQLATAGYDKKINLWDVENGQAVRTLTGHNGAVFDLQFSPSGKVLTSASGDQTLKLWNVATGQRLNTLGQPLKEQFAATISGDSKFVAGAGRDNRIRIWSYNESAKENPLLFAQFAHEQAIVDLMFSPDHSKLISASEDLLVKVWETKSFQQVQVEKQNSLPSSIAISSNSQKFAIGRLDGSVELYDFKKPKSAQALVKTVEIVPSVVNDSIKKVTESEPNETLENALVLESASVVSGKIESANTKSDIDLVRFSARKGEQWIVDVNASRSKSKLDSKVEILDLAGNKVPRVMLRAVRDSYFTFRGKDSNTSDDFRIHNWEEMELNEFLYAKGEVVKLWLYPRGPDSGFQVYPGAGKRYTYFDTSPNSHALNEPCYIVQAYPPGTEFTPNGLPVFTLYYENDDDARRRQGSDSLLTFTAPKDGDYFVRLSDVRGFQGTDYHYAMTVRRAKPSFSVGLGGNKPTVAKGGGMEFSLNSTRTDGYEGEIQVEITNVPEGFQITSPVVIQAGQRSAMGVIHATTATKALTAKEASKIKLLASATIFGKRVEKAVGGFGEIKFNEKPKGLIKILGPNAKPEDLKSFDPTKPLELTIEPGQTISAKVFVERKGHKGLVSFGNADSGRNLPHGVYVDNIGLNGLMIVPNSNERTFFVTAAKWVPEQTRMFHLRATNMGNECSFPVILHVRKSGLAKK